MKIRKYGLSIVAILVLFCFVGNSWAVESASQYKSVYVNGGFKQAFPAPLTGDAYLLYDKVVPKYYLLRFYIPPVEKSVSFALFCTQTADIGVVARLGAPPQCSSDSYSTSLSSISYYNSLPWDTRSARMQELRDRDWRIQNLGGTMSIMTDSVGSSRGEWLYVKVLFDGSSISHVDKAAFGVAVDPAAYEAWYNGATWDSNGDPVMNVNTSIATGSCDFTAEGGGVSGSSYTIAVAKQRKRIRGTIRHCYCAGRREPDV